MRNDQQIRQATLPVIEGGKVEGRAIVFGERTTLFTFINDRDETVTVYETIESGAVLPDTVSDVSLLVNHDRNGVPLARTTSGTLQLFINDGGVNFETHLDKKNPQSATVLSALNRGDLEGMSFGFIIGDEELDILDNGDLHYRITRIANVSEISIVTHPAYPTTNVTARSQSDIISAYRTMTVGQERIVVTPDLPEWETTDSASRNLLQGTLNFWQAYSTQLKLAHWNIQATAFFDLHVDLLDAMYDDASDFVDTIAEDMRKRGMPVRYEPVPTTDLSDTPATEIIEHIIEWSQRAYISLQNIIATSDQIEANEYVDQGTETRTWIWKAKASIGTANTPTLHTTSPDLELLRARFEFMKNQEELLHEK